MAFKKLKTAAALLALTATALAYELGSNLYTPVKPQDMEEAKPAKVTQEALPEKFDNLPWQEVIRLVQTPDDVCRYINWVALRNPQVYSLTNHRYTNDGYNTSSFKKLHEGAPIDCSESTLAALAMLSDNGYPAYFLAMESLTSGHTLPICKIGGKFRVLYGFDDPRKIEDYRIEYDSIEDIVKKEGFDKYMLIDLNKQRRKDWISGDGNYFNLAGSIQTYFPCLGGSKVGGR